MTSPTLICKNCSAPLTGKFCQECGQKADTHKITLSHLFHEFFHALTHTDKGILLLVKEMILRPGFVAKEYIDGKRKKYFNPFSFLVIASAIYALVVMKSGYFEAMGGGGNGVRSFGRMPEQFAMYMRESMEIFIHHGKIISLVLVVPLMTFLSWIFFKKPRYNFAENLVLQSLMMGQINLFMVIIFIPLYLIFGHARLNNNIFQITFLVYMIVAFKQFFDNNIFIIIIKTIIIHVMFILLYWSLLIGFVFVRHLF
ncbi:MAG: DUF3667 domain-containing protein [Chryseolinea sp.]